MNIFFTALLWASYLVSLYLGVYWLLTYMEKYGSFNNEKSKLKLKNYPFVSVIIPAHNEQDSIEKTAKSVLGLNYPHDKFEMIMVNDGSKDRTLEIMRQVKKANPDRDIKIITHSNIGKAGSMNKAMHLAKGEYFACLDADSFVDKDTLMKMMKLFEKDSSITIMTPAMKVLEPKNWIQKFQRLEYITSMFFMRMMGKMDMIYVAPGPFSVYKREVVKKLGGFDVGNLTEDMEIAYRMQKHHFKMRQCHDAYVYTIAPDKIKELYKQRNRWYKGGLINFIKYRKLFLNPKYGDFGIFMMPVILALYFFSIVGVGFFAYYTLDPLWNGLRNLFLINFNIAPHIADLLSFNFKFNILDLEFSQFSKVAMLLGISTLVLVLAHKNANESIRKHGLLHIIPYTLFYFIILSTFVCVILGQTILRMGKQKW
jgi:cellulose synthase/poly-beta-1,6-N-acetylglucosamine synthase-like glycosyltransferase